MTNPNHMLVCQFDRLKRLTLRKPGRVLLLGIILTLMAAAFSAPADASPRRKTVTHKVEFNGVEADPARLLDWRSPQGAFTFDIPDNDWVDNLELFLSARPIGPVGSQTQLMVTFNDAAPVSLQTDGYGFDARIQLDRSRISGQRNQVTVSYPAPTGETCLGPNHGSWDIDLADSFVVVKSRTKARPLSFHDVKTLISSPATAPQSVALITHGPEKLKLQVLAAQGISKNIGDIPNFRLNSTNADFRIIAAPRAKLRRWVKDKNILNGTGAQIAVAANRPLRLVLTGDTDAQVMEAAKAFSGAYIPASRLREVSAMRFAGTNGSLQQTPRISGKTPLHVLGSAAFSHDWAPRTQTMTFDIANPANAHGRLSLDLNAGPFIDPASEVFVTLNGTALGRTPLDHRRKKLRLTVPRGLLQGLDNKLSISAALTPSASQPLCAVTRIGPGFSLGAKSELTIRGDNQAAPLGLSQFTATGLPFSAQHGANTTVLISATTQAELQAALKVMAQLGRASHSGWGNAVFAKAAPENWPAQGNVLIMGSNLDLDSPLLAAAPKGLKTALLGAAGGDPITHKSASLIRPAETLAATRQTISGGVAAIYADQAAPGRIMGVITHTRGQSFARAAENLITPGHWNALEGSVARWNKTRVVLAQTAHSGQAMSPPKAPLFSRLEMPDFHMPDMGMAQANIIMAWHNFTGKTQAIIAGIRPRRRPAPLPEDTPNTAPNPLSAPPARQARKIPTPSLKPRPATAPKAMAKRGIARPAPPQLRSQSAANNWPQARPPQTSGQVPLTPGLTPPLTPRRQSEAALHYNRVKAQLASIAQATGQKVSDIIDHSQIGEFRAQESAYPKWINISLIGIGILLLCVFISPGKRSDK